MIGTKRITIGRIVIALAPHGGAGAGGHPARGGFLMDFGATLGLVAMLGIFGGFW